MAILSFLVDLLSSAMLLLFAVRFMRTGIERLWSAKIRFSLNDDSSAIGNLAKGAGLGLAMQGSTVVVLMVSGLAGSGAIPIMSAVLVALGADLGSALAVLFLQLQLSAVGPLAVLLGATIYLRAPKSRQRNLGRVVLGLGLIFLSLSLIRSSVEPIGTMATNSALFDYVNSDLVTMALVGLVLTFVFHSSVAALLTAVAIANHATLDPTPALAFMLGCNFGSAMLSLWLLKYENQRAKSVAYSVAILRCGMSVLAFVALLLLQRVTGFDPPMNATEAILFGHLGFNIALLLLSPAIRVVSDSIVASIDVKGDDGKGSAFDLNEDPTLALSTIKRKSSGMLDLLSNMLDEVASEELDQEAMTDLESQMNKSLAIIRIAYAEMPDLPNADMQEAEQVLDFAIRVERCGDMLSGRYTSLRVLQLRGEYLFSNAGRIEIAQLLREVRRGILLAQETVWTSKIPVAERLVRHKQIVSSLEQTSRRLHLERVRSGNPVSLNSSNHHLEVTASLKEINSKLATIGYSVLGNRGRLKKTRLKSSSPSTAS